jgi:hypothetical protein
MASVLNVNVNRVGDPPTPPKGTGKKLIKAEFTDAIILEAGTVEGNTTVSFFLTDEHGNQIFAEMTKNILDMLHGAVTGADWRFKNVPNDNLQ